MADAVAATTAVSTTTPSNGAASKATTPAKPAAPISQTAMGKQPTAETKGEAKGEAKPEAKTWGDEDKKALFELLKKSPYKLRNKGQETALDSEESFMSALMDAQRGRGASKLVEEAKREKAEAEKARTDAQRVAQLLEAARSGDMRALQQLGLEPPDVRAQREEAEKAIPPEVRAVIEENRRLAEELQRRDSEAQEAQQRAQQEAQSKQREAVRTEAMEATKSILEKLQVAPEHLEGVLPDVIQAMYDLTESGLELGQDYTEEHLLKLVAQRRDATTAKRLGQLKPQTQRSMTAEAWVGAKPSELRAELGDKFEAFAIGVARELKALRNGPKATTSAPALRVEDKTPAKASPWPLSPFRFNR